MNKKITSSVLTALIIAGTTSFSAFAAMANGTVVIGNKAFDLAYANDPTHADEITKAIVDGGTVYIKDFQGNWIDNTTELKVEASVIPAVTYKSVDGAEVKIDAKDAKEAEVATTMAVSSVSAINGNGTSVALADATISRNTTYSVAFNANVDKATVNNKSFKILKNGVLVAITTPSIVNFNTVTFNTQAALEANTSYTLVVEGVKSTDGKEVAKKEVAFKTATETVVRNVTTTLGGTSLYAPGYNAVANLSGIWTAGEKFNITLDEAIDKATLSSSTVKLINVTTGKALAVEATVNSILNNQIDVKIVGTNDFLEPRSQYKLVLDGVKAANANTVEAFNFNFSYQVAQPTLVAVDFQDASTIGKLGDTPVSPLLEGSLLGDKGTYALGAKFFVNFGAAKAKLDATTVNDSNFKLVNTDTDKEVAVAVTYNAGTNKVELTPTARLVDSKYYKITVSKNVKDVNGLNLLVATGKESFDSQTFETKDVTNPEIKTVSIVDGDLNNLKMGDVATIKVEFTEAIAGATRNTGSYSSFLDGSAIGNYIVQRADTNGVVGANANTNPLTINQALSTDGKTLTISITPNAANGTIINDITGVAYKVTFAGYNPSRYAAGATNHVIADNATIKNALASDYAFNFTVEGTDTVAPKVIGSKAQQGSAAYVALEGATNVQGNILIALDDKTANIKTASIADKVEFYQNGLLKSTVTLAAGNFSEVDNKAVIAVPVNGLGLDKGAVEARVIDVEDVNGNVAKTYRTNFVYGSGTGVTSTIFKTLDLGATLTADNASLEIVFAGTMDRSTVTSANVKVYDGVTEVAGTLDFTDFTTGDKVYFKPSTKFTAGKSYKVVVSKDVKDAKGNALQPVTTETPKAYEVAVIAPIAGAIQANTTGVFDQANRRVTFTFTQLVKEATSSFVIKNKATGAVVYDSAKTVNVATSSLLTVPAKLDGKQLDGKTVVVTLNDGFAKNTEYEISVTADILDSSSKTVSTTTFIPTAKLDADIVIGKPEFKAITAFAAGVFTIEFTEKVSVNEVKSALKIYEATAGVNVTLFDSSVVANNKDEYGYASQYTVTVPGGNGVNKEFYLSYAADSISDAAGFKNSDAYDKKLDVNVVGSLSDIIAPTKPVITTAATTNNAATIAIAGTTEAGTTITITGGAAPVIGTVAGTGYTATVTLTENAVNNLVVTATDAAGNISVTSTVAITEDSTIAVETAVGAYESAPITTLTQVATAEGLKAAADTAVANVGVVLTRTPFATRVTDRTNAIASAKVILTADKAIADSVTALVTPAITSGGADLGTLVSTDATNGTTITWTSATTTSLSNAGAWVSGATAGDVVLTAKISKANGTFKTVDFKVTVDGTKITAIVK